MKSIKINEIIIIPLANGQLELDQANANARRTFCGRFLHRLSINRAINWPSLTTTTTTTNLIL